MIGIMYLTAQILQSATGFCVPFPWRISYQVPTSNVDFGSEIEQVTFHNIDQMPLGSVTVVDINS